MIWPNVPGVGNNLSEFVPAGGYVSIVKSVPPLLLLLLWAKMLTWADKDADGAHLPRTTLNGANLGGLLVAYGAFFYLPTFILSFFVLLVVFGAEVGVYLQMRKKVVGLADLSQQWEDYKKSWQRKKVDPDGPEKVSLTGKDGKPVVRPDMESPDRPAYNAIQQALAEPLFKNAEQIDLAPSSQGLSAKYTVDGFAYTGTPIDPAAGAAGLAILKSAAGLNVEERRKPQAGSLKALADGRKMELKIQTAGSTAGEYMRLLVNPGKKTAMRLEELGLTGPQIAAIKERVKERSGIVLVAAPKAQGQTSLLYAIMRAHDAFIEHIHTVERDPEQAMEGITQNKLAGNATAADEVKQVDWVISQEPDVVGMSKVEGTQTAASLVDFAGKGKMVYVACRAGSTAEAVDQWRKLAGDKGLKDLQLVVCGRVMRKLCMACKESYAADPATVRKLGMDPAKVSTLFKAREVALRDPKTNQPIPCDFCKDLRFKGRTGVFELLVVDDDVRAALVQDYAKGAKAGGMLKAAFRKQRGKYLQEEALALVERGDTSVQEVLRVLRGGDAAPAAPQTPAAPAAAGRRRAAAPRPGPAGALVKYFL